MRLRLLMLAALQGLSGVAAQRPPVPMVWQFNGDTLSRKQYLKDVDFIKANTLVDLLAVAPVDQVNPEDPDQFHDSFKEMVEYAKAKGIRVVLRQQPCMKGFFNAGVDGGDADTYVIGDQSEAQGIAMESEAVLDANGFASVTESAKWGRNKIRPLRNELIAVYAFEKTDEGFYASGSVSDVTHLARVVARTSTMQTVEIDGGAALAGKTVCVLTAQYFNSVDQFGGAAVRYQTKIMDSLADVPLAGMFMDESGYLLLNVNGVNSGQTPPWRGRFYSAAQAKWWRENRNVDLKRLLFEMRYAPQGDEGVRIRAINRYMEVMRTQPCRNELEIVRHQKKLWGEDVFLACHSTFHNDLGADEVWHTGCDWWDVPRDFGFTDEWIDYPTRMGVLFGAKEPFLLHMFYSKKAEDYYAQIAGLLPFKGREFHHAYNDGVWGKGFRGDDRKFLENIRRFDEAALRLNAFQADVMPRMDGLVVFGLNALCNWYPDAKARNRWDINGSLGIQEKAEELWKLGYRVALLPDSKIEQGVLRIEGGRFVYNGRPFSHCVFLYPKYAKRCVYEFLNSAAAENLPLAVVGRADIDFEARPALFSGLRYDAWTPKAAEAIGMRKSAIQGGCVYDDGSFCLVSDALVTGRRTAFDFELDGVRHRGSHTGVYAWRNGQVKHATPGWASTPEPVKVIFDTDMYTDFDDAGALACLHALADAGECEILATVACTRESLSVAMCEIINAYYGRPEIPVGCVKEIGIGHDASGKHQRYYGATVEKYAKWVRHRRSDDAPDAVEVYRKVLSAQPDKSVVICSVGFLTNLRKLVETDRELVARKVKLWVAMACSYPNGKEYNSMTDTESSRIVLERWPTPIVFSDFQYGMDCFAGKALAESSAKDNPVADAFRINAGDFNGAAGRSAWDETAVLAAVRGVDSYFNVHRGTYRMIGKDGANEWVPDEEKGSHLRLTEKVKKIEVGKVIDELICRKPKSRR